MRILFMGSADFALPTLDALRLAGHEIAGVVSTPPKPQGRGLVLKDSPVAAYAKQQGLAPLDTPISVDSDELAVHLRSLNADLFVVVAFRILPKKIFSIPRLGTINLHASLLPKFRGPAPIHRAIEAGEHTTGVTVFRINEGIDTGQIILQKSVSISDLETTPQLYKRLAAVGAEAVVLSLEYILLPDASFNTQNETEVSKAPRLKKEEGCIDWSLPPQTLINKIRAFKPFPGTYTFLNGKRIGIEWALPLAAATRVPFGTIVDVGSDYFDVACKDGALRVLEVKPEGKPAMSTDAFLRGHTMIKGTIVQ